MEPKQQKIQEQIKKLRKELKKQPDLAIQRVPNKTEFKFKKLAQEEFCNDYGMCLKFLIDFYEGMLPTGNEAVFAKLEEHEQRLTVLETKPKEPEKVIRTLSGKKIKGVNRK